LSVEFGVAVSDGVSGVELSGRVAEFLQERLQPIMFAEPGEFAEVAAGGGVKLYGHVGFGQFADGVR
jgi:hypothetical protein